MYKDIFVIKKNADNLNNTSFFPLPEEKDGENGYYWPESSTKESDVDEDVEPGDDLDGYDEWSNTESDNKSKDGTLSRKILHAFRRQCCVI